MRILSTLMFIGRPIPQEPVPFKEMLPLKLKNKVSGKGNITSDVCCIYEMSVMFACFQDNEFQEKPCGQEVDAFQKCYTKHMTEKRQQTYRDQKGILTPGERDLTPKQINILLRKYPNF